MYVCLCKGLTESDVAMTARVWAEQGIEPEDVIETLGLRCEEACGYCEEHPELLLDIIAAEMERPISAMQSSRPEASQLT